MVESCSRLRMSPILFLTSNISEFRDPSSPLISEKRLWARNGVKWNGESCQVVPTQTRVGNSMVTSEDSSNLPQGWGHCPPSQGNRSQNTPRPRDFSGKQMGDVIREGRARSHLWGSVCPLPPKLRAPQAFPLRAGVCPFSLPPWCCSQETTPAGAGDQRQCPPQSCPLVSPCCPAPQLGLPLQ